MGPPPGMGGGQLGDVAISHCFDVQVGFVRRVDADRLQPEDRPDVTQRSCQAPQEQHVAASAVHDEQRRTVARGRDLHERLPGTGDNRRTRVRGRSVGCDRGRVPFGDRSGQRSKCLQLEDVGQLQANPELTLEASHQPDGDQRLPTQFEEVVVATHEFETQQISPDRGDPLLQWAFRLCVLDCEVRPLELWSTLALFVADCATAAAGLMVDLRRPLLDVHR
jgi:hypothetical protein